MERDLGRLDGGEFDLIVVGGGIFGACATWDATLRGLSVALLEAKDFAAGVSANSFKMVHGGIRYIQHLDFPRVRSSCRERSILLRIVPHLVTPLPIVIPTWRGGKKGKLLLGAGMALYDLATIDRNRHVADPDRRIPFGSFMDAQRVKDLFPALPDTDLTGGAVFSDAQMHNPTRLVLEFVRSAAREGATVANYARVERFVMEQGAVSGVMARDVFSGDEFQVRGKCVLNAAGPWAERLLQRSHDIHLSQPITYSRDACFVVPRIFPHEYALAVQGQTSDPDALLSRPARHLFIVPWRDFSLIGVWHKVTDVDPGEVDVGADEVSTWLEEIGEALPDLDLGPEQVGIWNAGLVPFGDNEPGAKNLSYGKRSHVIDHAAEHGIRGLVSLVGVRYTMGRGDAARAVDIACRQLGAHRSSESHARPLVGAGFERFDALVEEAAKRLPGMKRELLRPLLHNHGSGYEALLRLAADEPALLEPLNGSTVLKAEVVNAVRNEMALTLGDIVFRRTDLATAGHPGDASLRECAEIAARELGWNAERIDREIREVESRMPAWRSL